MLYKPSQGIFKDNCVFFHEGRYYLFSMYSALDGNHDDRNGYNHVWQAVSEDGVRWRDAGPVISAPFLVWAMGVWQAGCRFYLNHGIFTACAGTCSRSTSTTSTCRPSTRRGYRDRPGPFRRRVGLVVQNGKAVIEGLAAWEMTLD